MFNSKNYKPDEDEEYCEHIEAGDEWAAFDRSIELEKLAKEKDDAEAHENYLSWREREDRRKDEEG